MKYGIYFAGAFCILAGLCIVPVLLYDCIKRMRAGREKPEYQVIHKSTFCIEKRKCYDLVEEYKQPLIEDIQKSLKS